MMTTEQEIKQMVRRQWREEGDLTAPPGLQKLKRFWWYKEALKIEQEERESV
jgi:hypothetical protein